MTIRNKLLPLTETTFYILLALRQPSHGYQTMQTIEALSNGQVRIAAGTMYGAIENLQKQGLIQAVPSPDPRRKVYQITPYGQQILAQDVLRMQHMVHVFANKEVNHESI